MTTLLKQSWMLETDVAKITATMRSDLPVKHGWKGADQFIIVKGTWVEKLMAE